MLYNTINKYVTRLLAVLLAAALVFAAAPLAFAMEGAAQTPAENTETAETAPETPEETTAPAATSGSCGAGLNWSLSGGVLTITGSGAMTDFPESTMAPWYQSRNDINSVVLPSGLTTIGNLAFYDCKNLVTVNIPSTVTKIGDYAFAYCTGMEMLSLGSGVNTIEEAAFSDCYKLKAINLPKGLVSIGMKGFYRCESVTSVTVPSSVTQMGVSVFAYCKSLVSANIKASIKVLPEYTFYGCEMLSSVSLPDMTEYVSTYSFRGCDNLYTVHYGGTSKTPEEIQNSVGNSSVGFAGNGIVTDSTPETTINASTEKDNADGSFTGSSIVVTEGKESSVSAKTEITVKIEGTESENADVSLDYGNAEITVIINGANGWEEAKNAVEQELEKAGDKFGTVKIDVYVSDTSEINEEFVNSIAGKNITLTVMTADGSVWKINGMEMDTKEPSGVYDLSYTLTAGDAKLCEALGAQTSFVLMFNSPAAVNAEVLIRIGTIYARQNATLFQKDGGINRLQSVVVDSEGYAHFYLGSVSEKTEYYIAMNLPDAAGEAIIPQNMLAEYGYPEYTEPIKYEITGRESSWGMNLGQVMGILAAVMITVVIVVGVIMYIYNKRRLRNGYVPSFEDEE